MESTISTLACKTAAKYDDQFSCYRQFYSENMKIAPEVKGQTQVSQNSTTSRIHRNTLFIITSYTSLRLVIFAVFAHADTQTRKKTSGVVVL